jgi:hypothetical protein
MFPLGLLCFDFMCTATVLILITAPFISHTKLHPQQEGLLSSLQTPESAREPRHLAM